MLNSDADVCHRPEGAGAAMTTSGNVVVPWLWKECHCSYTSAWRGWMEAG